MNSEEQLSEYRRLAVALYSDGLEVAGTYELLDVTYHIEPRFPWFAFAERKLDPTFAFKELLWYVNGDPTDDSIGEHATIWKDIFERDEIALSNYGYELFTLGALAKCVRMLKGNVDTRRAVAFISENDHVGLFRADQPCTTSMQFLIRNNTLHTIVSMRSQDLIYGLGNDSIFFSFVAWCMARAIGVYVGPIHMHVGSLHVYERHYEMLEELMNPTPIYMPWEISRLSPGEAMEILRSDGTDGPFLSWVKEQL